MTVSERDLVAAIESTLHFYPPVPGLVDDLAVSGVQGRVTKVSHPLANLVGMARLDDENADATIERVKRRYTAANLAFGWVTGPNTTPRDLDRRLAAAGLRWDEEATAGMALTDIDTPIATNPDVAIREVATADLLRENEMMARAYGMPVEVSELFVRMLGAASAIRSRAYLASLGDGAPIAWSFLVYIPNSPIVLLGGAATVPEARGRGAYTALVKRRLDDARADGREAAIIQAGHMSAPICATVGFRVLCSLHFFIWEPPK